MDDKINMEVSDCPHLIQHFPNYELPSDNEALDPGEEQEVNRVRRGRLAGSTDGQLDAGEVYETSTYLKPTQAK